MPSSKAHREPKTEKEEKKAVKKPKESLSEILKAARQYKPSGSSSNGPNVEILDKKPKFGGVEKQTGLAKPGFKASYD